MEEIPIFLTFDDRFVLPGGVAIYSLLKNASTRYRYRILIAGGRIGEAGRRMLARVVGKFGGRARIEYLDNEFRINEIWEKLRNKNHFTVEVAYKLFIASIFPEYDKILISDVDVVFLDDVSKAFVSFDPSHGGYFAGVRPVSKVHPFYDEFYSSKFSAKEIEGQKNGVSGGFLVSNLRRIREDGMEEAFLRCFAENSDRLVQSEQDVINLACAGNLSFLPLRYLVCAYVWDLYESDLADISYSRDEISEAKEHPVQLHYPGKPKPWESPAITKSDLWFDYMRESGLVFAFLSERFRARSQLGSKRLKRSLASVWGLFRDKAFSGRRVD